MRTARKAIDDAVNRIMAGELSIAQAAVAVGVSESVVKQWLGKRGVSLKGLESTGGGSATRGHLLAQLVGLQVTAVQAAELLGINPLQAWWLLDASTTRAGRVRVTRISGRLDDSVFDVRWTT